jgi:enoyl-CoA hydratase/carnithine racemase
MTVSIEELGSARVISWDRRARRNAWDLPTMTAIADALEAAGDDETVRVVIVRGAGGHFSAGDDLFAAIEANSSAWADTIEAFQRLTRVVLALPVPVIAAIDGACVGGALEFAASCDIRLGTPRVRLGTPEVTIGLVLSNAGTIFLPAVLGETAARQLLLTGVIQDAGWGAAHGFFTQVSEDLDQCVMRWSFVFDATSRAAVDRTKAMLNNRFGAQLGEAMERETRNCIELFDGPDAPSALRGFADARRG